MNGWLICNHFLGQSPKFAQLKQWFMAAAKKEKIELISLTNLEVLPLLSEAALQNPPDFVLFWDKDVRLASYLERKGLKLYNCADAIAACDDKSLTYIQLSNQKIRMPKTFFSPMIYFPVDWNDNPWTLQVLKEFSFPFVLKEAFGSFGEQVYLIHTKEELISTMNAMGTKPFLIQEFIASSKGRDIRIQVVGNQAIACMYRYSDSSDFRANISHGGKMKAYQPDEKQIQMALDACRALSLDFAGVDILFGARDEPILCEVNSNAHFINIHEVTGVNTAEHIMRYLKTEER